MEMDATVQNATVLRDWLFQMGRGASDNQMTIQYCMAPSMHILQSLEIPSVTQVWNTLLPCLDQSSGELVHSSDGSYFHGQQDIGLDIY